ncbi:MAG: protein kinase [archaeon]|nr:protein kinase [archaeon]
MGSDAPKGSKEVSEQDLIYPEHPFPPYTHSSIRIVPSLFMKENKDDYQSYYNQGTKIGDGGFATVKKVEHYQTKIIRAIKTLDLKQKGNSLQTCLNEIEINKNLDHPYIVQTYEYYLQNDSLSIVQEYIDKGDLFALIQKKKKFSEPVACQIITQIASAIKYLHDNYYVHRDIKPENVLIVDDQNIKIKLIDFGTCQKLQGHKTCNDKIGTPSFMPPEMIQGQPYDYKCDVWSLGIILVMMLTGSKPFKAIDNEELFEEITKVELKVKDEQWNGISEEAKYLAWKMLKKDPTKRFTINAVLESDWIKKYNTEFKSKINPQSIKGVNTFIENIKKFNIQNKMQLLALYFIFHSNLNLSSPEIKEIEKLFVKFDEDLDGRLSKAEFTKGLSLLISDKAEVDKLTNKIFGCFEDKNNPCPFISYETFLLICAEKKSLLTPQNIQNAFKFFDRRMKAKISDEDLMEILKKGNFGMDFEINAFNNFCKEIGVTKENALTLVKYNQLLKDITV